MKIRDENIIAESEKAGLNNGQINDSSRFRRLLRDLAASIRGTELDYTQGSIRRAILLLSIPMMLEMAMESTFAIVDVYFVASLGASAVATVGLTESILTLMYSIAMGLSMAATAMVARRVGEKNHEGASTAAVQAIIVAIVASIPFTVAGIFFSKQILTLMGADEWSITHGYRYTVWMLGGNAVIMLIFVMNAIFRGAGDAAIAMRVLIISNCINIVLDPALIFGWGPFPEMGLEGAAIATNIGRGTGIIIQAWTLLSGGKHIKVLIGQVRIRTEVIIRLLKTSLGGIGQFIIATTSWVFLVRIVSEFGSEAVAGYTIAVRIFIFTLMPAWGMSNAASTLVGQNLGANQPERAERSVWITGLANMIFLVIVAFFYITFNESLIKIFTNDPKVIAMGSECLRVVSYGYLFYAWGMVMPQAFNGAGDTVTPTKINFFCFWLFEIPLAWLLSMNLGYGETGVYWSIVIAESTAGLVAIWLFSRGKWKQAQV
ncbi:MAG TPA: MATE family efflux transporter [Cyclobacteriaceae bacterium]|nr:MATE family efflux transporter [Cyclobacteriaceae bacterium]